MKFNRALTLIMVSVSLVFGFAFVAEARAFGHGRGIGPDLGGLKAFLELKLSDSQQGQMVNIIDKYQTKIDGLRNSARESRKNLARIMRAKQFNEGEARKAFREASAVREEMFLLRAKMMVELKAVLTPEQLASLKERRAQRMEKVRHAFDAWLEEKTE